MARIVGKSAALIVLIGAVASAQTWPRSPIRPGALDRGITLIVNWDGTGDHTNIQAAINAAADGDTVLVMPSVGSPLGAYVENLSFLAKAITVRSTDPLDPGVVATTVIDGNNDGRVITFEIGAGADTVLDGFTLRNGLADYGGAIYSEASSPTINRCVFTQNTAVFDGGAIYCTWAASLKIAACTFTDNHASSYGGAICCYNDSNLTMTDSTVSGNTGLAGSGIACFACSPLLTGCFIMDNQSAGGT